MFCIYARCPRGRAVNTHFAAALVISTFAYWCNAILASACLHAGDAAGDGDACELAVPSAADARSILAAFGRDCAAADGDIAAGAIITAADARAIKITRGRDGAAADGDIAAGATIITAADARSIGASRRRDGAAADGDISAGGFITAADARSIGASRRRHAAVADGDVAADGLIAATDARSILSTRRRHAAAALNGERRTAAARLYGGIALGRGRDGVRAVEDDGGVAAALDGGAGGDADGGHTEREGLAAADGDGAADAHAATGNRRAVGDVDVVAGGVAVELQRRAGWHADVAAERGGACARDVERLAVGYLYALVGCGHGGDGIRGALELDGGVAVALDGVGEGGADGVRALHDEFRPLAEHDGGGTGGVDVRAVHGDGHAVGNGQGLGDVARHLHVLKFHRHGYVPVELARREGAGLCGEGEVLLHGVVGIGEREGERLVLDGEHGHVDVVARGVAGVACRARGHYAAGPVLRRFDGVGVAVAVADGQVVICAGE